MKKAEEALKKANGDHHESLRKVIAEKSQMIKQNEKATIQLKQEINKKRNSLAKSYVDQEKLRDKLENLQDKYKAEKKNSYFSKLQLERESKKHLMSEEQHQLNEKEMEQVLNDILDQQERDQKKSWWEKIPIRLNPSISLEHNSEGEKVLQREHNFYPNLLSKHLPVTRVKEEYNPKTKKWQIIDEEKRIKSEQK